MKWMFGSDRNLPRRHAISSDNTGVLVMLYDVGDIIYHAVDHRCN